jgi:hypothetical protein
MNWEGCAIDRIYPYYYYRESIRTCRTAQHPFLYSLSITDTPRFYDNAQRPGSRGPLNFNDIGSRDNDALASLQNNLSSASGSWETAHSPPNLRAVCQRNNQSWNFRFFSVLVTGKTSVLRIKNARYGGQSGTVDFGTDANAALNQHVVFAPKPRHTSP